LTLAVLAGAIVLAALGIHLVGRQARKAASRPPPSWIIDPGRIRAILDQALENRARVDVSFYDPKRTRKAMPCALLKVSDQTLTLEPPARIKLGQSWMGRVVKCYFGVPAGEGEKKIFYIFTAEIKGVKRRKDGTAVLQVGLPERLVMGQKRQFLRIAPATGQTPELFIWPMSRENEGALAEYLGRGPEAVPVREDVEHKVQNISGGGIRVESRLETREAREYFGLELGKSCLVGLGLSSGGPHVERYGLEAKVANLFDDFKNLELGLQFQSRYLRECDVEGRPLSKPLDEVDEEIEQWVITQNLRMLREKGVAE
jgi:hypothetical protein